MGAYIVVYIIMLHMCACMVKIFFCLHDGEDGCNAYINMQFDIL